MEKFPPPQPIDLPSWPNPEEDRLLVDSIKSYEEMGKFNKKWHHLAKFVFEGRRTWKQLQNRYYVLERTDNLDLAPRGKRKRWTRDEASMLRELYHSYEGVIGNKRQLFKRLGEHFNVDQMAVQRKLKKMGY
jgi:hypothetical protein